MQPFNLVKCWEIEKHVERRNFENFVHNIYEDQRRQFLYSLWWQQLEEYWRVYCNLDQYLVLWLLTQLFLMYLQDNQNYYRRYTMYFHLFSATFQYYFPIMIAPFITKTILNWNKWKVMYHRIYQNSLQYALLSFPNY